MHYRCLVASIALVSILLRSSQADDTPIATWKMGLPMVSYWAGPGFPGAAGLTDAAAVQLAEGGWNLVWCSEKELDVVERHGLRGLLTDPLLTPAALEDPKQHEALDALIARVRQRPALHAYHLIDEPNAATFART